METRNVLNWIELSRSALNHNLDSLARLAGQKRKMSAAVKANAYGHGLREIVELLAERNDLGYLTVHSVEEAIACRTHGWSEKIMVLGPIARSDLEAVFTHDLEPVIFTTDTLAALGKLANKRRSDVRTHLKLETGTHRQGIREEEIERFAAVYRKHQHLKRPYGASMHFANIEDTTNHEFADGQLERFKAMVKMMSRHGIKPTICHTAASAALILFEKTRFDLVRPGIAVYGHWPSKETYLTYFLQGGRNDLFRSILSWKTRITQLKRVEADSFIGYGCTYRTTSPTRLAVLPIGYFDGYDRLMSNRAYVLIRGKRAPVRGRICMNLTMVDVTDIKGVRLGDEAVLIGSDGEERLSAEQLADWSQTVNYEVLARLNPATPRYVVD